MPPKMTEGPCHIVIVDDDPGMRDSLEALVAAKGHASTSFETATRFLDADAAPEPSCIIMDYAIAGTNGLEALRILRERGDARPVIMITAHGEVQLAVDAMRAGASDFIEKPWDRDALFQAIERAATHARDAAELARKKQAAREAIASFTPREKQVFEHLISGASNKVVARALNLSPRTVEFYRANVLDKAGVHSVAGLVRLAYAAKGESL